MGKKTEATVQIDGLDSLTTFNSFLLVQRLFGHHEFELRVPIGIIEAQSQQVLSNSKDLVGKKFGISVESPGIQDRPQLNFVGVITNVSLMRVPGGGSEVMIKGNSPTILLEDGKATRSFEEMDLNDLAREILNEYDSSILDNDVESLYQNVLPYVVQYGESNFQLLSRLSNDLGDWMFYNGEKLTIGGVNDDDFHKLVLGRDLEDFEIDLAARPLGFDVQSYFAEQNELFEVSGTFQPDVDNVYGASIFSASEAMFPGKPLGIVKQEMKSQGELAALADRTREHRTAELVKLTANSDYHPLTIGSVVLVEGNKAEDPSEGLEQYGEFRITNIIHRVDGNGNYQNRFEGIPKEMQRPPLNPLVRNPKALSQPAIVVDHNDPQKQGRVRVRHHWQKDGQQTPWIRMMQKHAGAEHGSYVIPEIDDEVLIGFEYGRPDRPLVVGSLYHGNAAPGSHLTADDNMHKGIIRTKSGNEIKIVDEGGKESIHILNKGGKNSIVLTMDGGAINISAASTINITSKEINITGEDKIKLQSKLIEMEASDTIKSKAKFFNVNADNQISMFVGQSTYHNMDTTAHHLGSANFHQKATGNADMEATGNFEIKGLATTVEGTASAEVKAPMVTVKGQATTSVESTGITTVKGAMVKMN